MRAFLAQFKREIRGLLFSPYAFVLLGFWFLLNGFFFAYLLHSPAVQNDLTLLPPYLFGNGLLVWLLLPAFPPLLALRLLAEEQRVGTMEPLLTAPVRDLAVILAKYLAACAFLLVFWAGVASLFLLLQFHGATLDWGRITCGFIGEGPGPRISVRYVASSFCGGVSGFVLPGLNPFVITPTIVSQPC